MKQLYDQFHVLKTEVPLPDAQRIVFIPNINVPVPVCGISLVYGIALRNQCHARISLSTSLTALNRRATIC